MRNAGKRQTITFLLLHRRADIAVLMPVDGIDDLVATTQLHFDDRVLELRDTCMYLRRQSAIATVGDDVTAQVFHARQQRLNLSAAWTIYIFCWFTSELLAGRIYTYTYMSYTCTPV